MIPLASPPAPRLLLPRATKFQLSRCLSQMMEKGYRATGWLGLFLGTRLYYSFHGTSIATDEAFAETMDQLTRGMHSTVRSCRLKRVT